MSSQLSTTIGTAFQMIFEEERQIRIQFAVDVSGDQISFADLFTVACSLNPGNSLCQQTAVASSRGHETGGS